MPGLGVGIQQIRRRTETTPGAAPPPVLAPSVLTAPVISGTPRVGQVLTLTDMTTLPAADLLQQRWVRDGIPIAGSTGQSYQLSPQDDQTRIVVQQRARAGQSPWTAWTAAGGFDVIYAAPVAGAILPDVLYVRDSGDQIVDAAGGVSFALGGSWSVTGAGAQIDASGVVTIPTTADLPMTPVTVRYTNSGGTAATAFNVSVTGIPITATLQPVTSVLYDGQTIADMADFASMTAVDNFTSIAAAISSVEIVVREDEVINPVADETKIWSTGDFISFDLIVTDGLGNVRTFTTEQVGVEYRAISTLDTVNNTFTMQFNEIVPDTETAPLVVSGLGAMDGVYQVLKSDTLGTAPFVLAGSITPEFAGDLSDVSEGDIVTLNPGLWFASQGRTLTFSKQVQISGLDVGTPGDSYTIAGDDLGNPLRVKVTADDGVSTPVVALSGAVTLPAGSVYAFEDTFTDSDATELTSHTPDTGTGWQSFVGTNNAVVTNNRLDFSNSATSAVATEGISSNHILVEVDVFTGAASKSTGPAALLTNAGTGNENGYFVFFNRSAQKVLLRKWTNGSVSTVAQIAPFTIANNTTYKIGLGVNGPSNTQQVFVDGVLVLSASDTAHTAPGEAGLAQFSSSDAYFDTFRTTTF